MSDVALGRLSEFTGSKYNRHVLNVKSFCGWLSDGPLKIGSNASELGWAVSTLTGNEKSAATSRKVNTIFNTADAALSSFRFGFEFYNLGTGQTFFKTQPTTYNNEGKVEDQGGFVTDSSGQKVWRNPLDIATDLAILPARSLSFARFFHNVGAYQLKDSAVQGMNHATTGLWGAVNLFTTVKSVRDCAVAGSNRGQKVWDVAHAVIEDLAWLLGLFRDIFGSSSSNVNMGLTIATAAVEIVNGVDTITRGVALAD